MNNDGCNADICFRIEKTKKAFAKIPQQLISNVDLEIIKKLLKICDRSEERALRSQA